MIDLSILRNQPDLIKDAIRRRGVDIDVDALVSLDADVRRARQNAEETRAEQKESGKAIAGLQGDEKQAAIEAAAALSEQFKEQSAAADALQQRFDAIWIDVPNLVDPSAADGFTDADNVEIKRVGDIVTRNITRDHAELGALLDVIDTERGAKVSGARFGYLKGKAVLLEFALVRYALDRLTEAGFTPMVPPVLVKEDALFGTGFFPDAREQVYAVPEDELFLVGTAEVPLAAYHMDEIFEAGELPKRYVGFSTCFRREAGTYGKDTAGIFRVHQFDKVEMFVFTEPELSVEEHDRLLAYEESIVRGLDVPYRVVNVAAGDLGAPAAKKYDIEAWFPGQQAYREITSCSNTTDFQARRLKVRQRTESGNRVIHTLNGTAVAVGRTILTILENHQQPDGSVVIPEALRPYTGFESIEP
ncbi:MAG: serine--tRNA ligase [Acidimicrobiia bacterium]|nr:serine--tRNA ligase [Acidimicrobiia bacterium]MDH4307566.1 serine--tRNA ligase [Acidimicrobiia bacterium]